MPLGSRRFLTSKGLNPTVTTLTFDSPQGAGSSQPQHFSSVSITGDTAGNTVNGNGTYNGSDTKDLAAGILGGANHPICVPLTENRTYVLRLRKTTHSTISGGTHSTATYPYTDTMPRLSTTKANSSSETDVVASRPRIDFVYGRIRDDGGGFAYGDSTTVFQLHNHDRSSDVVSGSNPYVHTFNFLSADAGNSTGNNAMLNDTLTLSQTFTVASGDNNTVGEDQFTAKGLVLQYNITNTGLGVAGDVTLELFQI